MVRPAGPESDHSAGLLAKQGPSPDIWEQFNTSNVNATNKYSMASSSSSPQLR